MDWPSTEKALTSARPIINADAVDALRRGLRMAFSRPSRPVAPNRAGSGLPMTLVTGRASSGERVDTPRKASPAPMPTTAAAPLPLAVVRPSTSSAAPMSASAPPATPRIRSERAGSTKVSRIAATGGTDAALRAGTNAATAVTMIPTA